MLKICEFALKYTFKKWSTWLFLVIITVAMTVTINFVMDSSTGKGGMVIDPLSSLTRDSLSFIPYLLFAIFFMSYMAIKISNIFKDGESDGTTLLLISKKYTRLDIIIGRLLAVLVHNLMFSLITFIAFLIPTIIHSTQGVSGVDTSLLFSTIWGSLFVGLMLSSISLILVVIIGKVGTLTVSVIAGALLPTISVALQASSNLEDSNDLYHKYQNRIYGVNNKGGIDQEQLYIGIRESDTKEFNDVAINNSYNSLSYIDIWGQMTKMFSIFHPSFITQKHEMVKRNASSTEALLQKMAKLKKQVSFKIDQNDSQSITPLAALDMYFAFEPKAITGEPYPGYSDEYFNDHIDEKWINSDVNKLNNLLNNIDNVYYYDQKIQSEDSTTDKKLYKLDTATMATTNINKLFISPDKIAMMYNYLKSEGELPNVDSTEKYTLIKSFGTDNEDKYSLFKNTDIPNITWLNNMVNNSANQTTTYYNTEMDKVVESLKQDALTSDLINYESFWQDHSSEYQPDAIGRLGSFMRFDSPTKKDTAQIQNAENQKWWVVYKTLFDLGNSKPQGIFRHIGLGIKNRGISESRIKNVKSEEFKVLTIAGNGALITEETGQSIEGVSTPDSLAFLNEKNAYWLSLGLTGVTAPFTDLVDADWRGQNPNENDFTEYIGSTDFVSTAGVIVFYSILALGLFGATIFVHKRRDFK